MDRVDRFILTSLQIIKIKAKSYFFKFLCWNSVLQNEIWMWRLIYVFSSNSCLHRSQVHVQMLSSRTDVRFRIDMRFMYTCYTYVRFACRCCVCVQTSDLHTDVVLKCRCQNYVVFKVKLSPQIKQGFFVIEYESKKKERDFDAIVKVPVALPLKMSLT